MNKICTSLKQSKKLLELGINISTADMHYVLIDSDKEIYDIGFGDYIGILPHYPAWSLSALLDVLPVLKRIGYEKAKPNIHFNVFTNKWVCNSLYYTSNNYDNPIDTVFEMIVWLKENGKYE